MWTCSSAGQNPDSSRRCPAAAHRRSDQSADPSGCSGEEDRPMTAPEISQAGLADPGPASPAGLRGEGLGCRPGTRHRRAPRGVRRGASHRGGAWHPGRAGIRGADLRGAGDRVRGPAGRVIGTPTCTVVQQSQDPRCPGRCSPDEFTGGGSPGVQCDPWPAAACRHRLGHRGTPADSPHRRARHGARGGGTSDCHARPAVDRAPGALVSDARLI